jgi:hypothetical protein
MPSMPFSTFKVYVQGVITSPEIYINTKLVSPRHCNDKKLHKLTLGDHLAEPNASNVQHP